MDKSFYQSTQDQAIEEFEKRLLKPSRISHAGFDSHMKAMDPSIAETAELNLGYLNDKELAAEIDTLNSFLREERGMYDRFSHFFNILDGAQQRIRHLSGRLARAEGREVFDPQANIQLIGRLHVPTPVDQGYLTRRSLVEAQYIPLEVPGVEPMDRPWDLLNPDDGDVTAPIVSRPWDGRGGFGASGMEVHIPPAAELPYESFASSTKEANIATRLNAVLPDAGFTLRDKSASFIPADGAPIETVLVGAALGQDFQGDWQYAVMSIPEVVQLNSPSGILASAGFGVTWGDFKKRLDSRSSVITRIGVLVDRLCFKMEVRREHKLSELANKILQKHPEVSNQLVLACFEMANPDMLGASAETLDKLYKAWLELVDVVDPCPSRNSEG